MKINAACTCHMGLIRGNNEDNFFFNGKFLNEINEGLFQILNYSGDAEKGFVCGVFDGMGGESCGETASYLAAREMCNYIKHITFQEIDLNAICLSANDRICASASDKNGVLMGSTAVLLKISEWSIDVANLGDSRAYLFRDEKLQQVSHDHTDKVFLEEHSIQRKPRLTQHLGIEPREMLIEPFCWTTIPQNGDVLLLCSDGLTDMLTDAEIVECLKEYKEPNRCVAKLLSKALVKGGKDNATVIICQICN